MSVRLELVERLLVLRQAQHERLKHLRAGAIVAIIQAVRKVLSSSNCEGRNQLSVELSDQRLQAFAVGR